MWGIDRAGGDIDIYKNISSLSDCNRKCKENDKCFVWTYVMGSCYLKSGNTFYVDSPNIVTGLKNCRTQGKPKTIVDRRI